MSMMTLAQAHTLLPSSTLVGDPHAVIHRVHTDTRSLKAGDLFVALKGEHFDAHDYLVQARAAGAVAVIAERGDFAQGLRVGDTQAALEAMSLAWRQRFTLPMVAVTGSNGKTTVTQMIASILRAWHGDGAFSTQGNFNNHIGVPLTLLRLRQDDAQWHRAGVVELGMNHPGEIARLAALTLPTVALVNNAQREHQEFMASVQAVAEENGSVIGALGSSGVAVFPSGDVHTALWARMAGARRVITFGRDAQAQVRASGTWQGEAWGLSLHTEQGLIETMLAIPGEHNLMNAAAACACALAAGAPNDSVKRGLASFSAVKGRLQMRSCKVAGRDAVVVDDSYNANPDSVLAAIDVLASMPAPHWLLLGDMGEVGDQGQAFHAEVGAYARERGLQHVWLAGDLCMHAAAAHGGARHFADAPAIVDALDQAPACASVLVKGSRFMGMERVVEGLQMQAMKNRAILGGQAGGQGGQVAR